MLKLNCRLSRRLKGCATVLATLLLVMGAAWWWSGHFVTRSSYLNSPSLVKQLRPRLPSGSALVWHNELGVARNQQELKLREHGYQTFAFNSLVSTRLGVNRSVPDTRHKACGNLVYDVVSLPTVSVVICFYHEELWTLLRSLHSVIERTPATLLHEVILVNDHSDIDIRDNITEHIRQYNIETVVRLVTPPERLGLIRARIYGARKATGDVLVFLDSHVEANVQWVEPLLDRIRYNKTIVAMPIIDIIDADTFQYKPSPMVRGGFNWGLNFCWDPIPREELKSDQDFARPFRSPTMAGGLFAMDRQFFHDLGEYDPGMNVWGGENLELSFRVWMCGGSLELVPCSRLGHVFRKRRPYGAGTPHEEDSMIRNSLRVAHVWMDEYIRYYFQTNEKARHIFFGNVTDRQLLRQRLQCRSFKWYLDTVYPSLTVPDQEPKADPAAPSFVPWNKRARNYKSAFVIQLAKSSLCLQTEGDVTDKKAGLIAAHCNTRDQRQVFYETDRQELVLAKLLCLDAGKQRPRLMKCHELGGSQQWKFMNESRTAIYNLAAGLCLSVEEPPARGSVIVMDVCANVDSFMWNLITVSDVLLN